MPIFEASHILLKKDQYSKTEAQQMLVHLQQHPEDFGKVAGEKSGCPSGKNNLLLQGCKYGGVSKEYHQQCQNQYGGYLGKFDGAQMVPSFSNQLAKMKPGDIALTEMPEFNAFTIIKRHK